MIHTVWSIRYGDEKRSGPKFESSIPYDVIEISCDSKSIEDDVIHCKSRHMSERDGSDINSYHTNVTQINKKITFRPIFGARNFENFISGFRLHHQKMQNLILREVKRRIFKILCHISYVPQKSILTSLAKNCHLVW